MQKTSIAEIGVFDSNKSAASLLRVCSTTIDSRGCGLRNSAPRPKSRRVLAYERLEIYSVAKIGRVGGLFIGSFIKEECNEVFTIRSKSLGLCSYLGSLSSKPRTCTQESIALIVRVGKPNRRNSLPSARVLDLSDLSESQCLSR